MSLYSDPSLPARWRAELVEFGVLLLHHLLPARMPAFEAGSLLHLCWQDYSENVVLELPASVLAVEDLALRISLQDCDQGTWSRVQALLNADPPGSAPAVQDGSLAVQCRQRIIDAIRGPLARRFEQLLQRTCLHMQQVYDAPFEEVAGMPVKVAVQRLESLASDIQRAAVDSMLHSWNAAGTAAAGNLGRNVALRLVDDEEMQTWLTRTATCRALEREGEAAWRRLLVLLEAATKVYPALKPERLAADAVLAALDQACHMSMLEPGLQRMLLRVAARPGQFDLATFHELLEVDLGSLGLPMPEASAAYPRASARSTEEPERSASPPEPAGASSAASAGTARPYSAAKVSVAHAMNALQRLRQLRGEQPASAAGDTPASDEVLQQALRELSANSLEQASAEEFLQRLQSLAASHLGGTQVRFDERQGEALELIAWMNQSIQHDPLIDAPFRDWGRQLMSPILGTQLQPQGLSDTGEQLRELFRMLEFGSALVSERTQRQSAGILDSINEQVARLAQQSTLSSGQIGEASLRLEALLQRHLHAAHAIESRVVQACEGQQRLLDARLVVNDTLALLFDGRQVPEALAQLLHERLHALLVLAVLRHGADSEAWRDLRHQLHGLDQALRAAAEGRELPADPASDLAWLYQWGSPAATDQTLMQDRLAILESCLRGETVPWCSYPIAAADQSRRLVDWLSEPDADEHTRALALLEPGDWLSFAASGEAARALKLAWRAPDRKRFVFVGQLGHKAADLTMEQLLQRLRDGSIKLIEDGGVGAVERAWRSMLESQHGRIAEQVGTDPLTGLINRKQIDRQLLAWRSARKRPPLALLWIACDHLRVVNENRGMEAGDQVLRQLARLLGELAAADENTQAARIAGDEFALLLTDAGAERAEGLAELLLARLQQQEMVWQDQRFHLSVSIGLSAMDAECSDAESLLKDAERACRAAKGLGRGRIYRHSVDDYRLKHMRETVDWVGRVEQALESDSLVLFGQRALSLSDRAQQQPDYLEVLLRMRSDERMVSPQQFIIAAERYGQIAAIDRYVVRRLANELECQRLQGYRVAFNLSAYNMVEPLFIDEIIGTLSRYREQGDLCIELTETAAIEHLAEAQAGMRKLGEAGFTLVLDDFGTGWSSYHYLRRLPCQVVKVDGAFIRDISRSPEDLALARSINEIAQMLGKLTIAEHVEDEKTLDLVREIGFDYAQGYFIEHPSALTDILR